MALSGILRLRCVGRVHSNQPLAAYLLHSWPLFWPNLPSSSRQIHIPTYHQKPAHSQRNLSTRLRKSSCRRRYACFSTKDPSYSRCIRRYLRLRYSLCVGIPSRGAIAYLSSDFHRLYPDWCRCDGAGRYYWCDKRMEVRIFRL